MTAKDIQEKLTNKFDTHKYILNNSYIYDWECDFFSINTSGYTIEIEIKLSYLDFKADFRKIDKHRALKAKYEGAKTLLHETGKEFKYSFEECKTLLIDGKRVWDEEKGIYKRTGTGKIKTGTINTNYIDNFADGKLNFEYQQIQTNILINDIICPNKMYYICPKGIIPVEEVPEYCGLYYINDNFRITEIKKAPFITKEKFNITRTLLDKFYYKSIKLENKLKQISL